MLAQSYDTGGLVEQQALSLVGEPWATEVVPRLPATLAAQARTLKAFQRVHWRHEAARRHRGDPDRAPSAGSSAVRLPDDCAGRVPRAQHPRRPLRSLSHDRPGSHATIFASS